jgi:general secretion pathway protein G
MGPSVSTKRRGFSLVELVIVVVILGIIGAIAIPRMSRGASGAGESALIADLAALRNAIELYAAEHDGTYPTAAGIVNQLTQYTDASGTAQATPDATHVYGPYLHSIPTLKVAGARKGSNGIAAADADGIGWIYTATTGTIKANSTETSSDGATTYDQF